MVYNNQSGRRNFGKRDFNGPTGFRQMYKVVCGSCGRDCEVPFRPSGDRPVFCSNCFEKNRGTTATRRFEDRSSRPLQNNEQLNAINTKLDKILAILTSADSLLKAASTPIPKVVEETNKPTVLSSTPEEPKIIVEKKKKTSKKTLLPPKV